MALSSSRFVASLGVVFVASALGACEEKPAPPPIASDPAPAAPTSAAPTEIAATAAPSAVAEAPAPEPSASAAAAPASAAPAAPAGTVAGTRSGPATEAAAPTAAPSAPAAPKGPVAGKPWQVVASAKADAGYKCNDAYPHKFTTSGGTNVTYPDPKPRGACAGDSVAVTVPFVPSAAGPGTVSGTLSYGICDAAKTSCLMKKKEVTLPFEASAP